MSDYNKFVLAVNKIFEITAKIKANWKDQDSINIADSIEESKTTVVEAAKRFNTQITEPSQTVETNYLKDDEIGVLDE